MYHHWQFLGVPRIFLFAVLLAIASTHLVVARPYVGDDSYSHAEWGVLSNGQTIPHLPYLGQCHNGRALCRLNDEAVRSLQVHIADKHRVRLVKGYLFVCIAVHSSIQHARTFTRKGEVPVHGVFYVEHDAILRRYAKIEVVISGCIHQPA